MGTALAANTAFVVVIQSPSIFAGGSATANIEAQDKDRTVNVGHHIGRFTIDIGLQDPTNSGVFEYVVMQVERATTTPTLGNFNVPTSAEIISQGAQQACRMENPGRVFHFSQQAYTIETTTVKRITVSPAKFKRSKCKAGDHWLLIVTNRGAAAVNVDIQMRYKEYE